MNLGLVARISTIVDYCQCREAVYVYLRDWLNEYARRDNLPPRLCKISLLCLEGLAQIDTADLPLGGILDKIDKKRQSLILYYILSLDQLQDHLIKEDGCPMKQDPECTALTLGVLMRARRKMTDSTGPLEHPFDGHCVASVLGMITDIKEPSPPHDDIFRHHSSRWNRTSYPCCIGDEYTEAMECVKFDVDAGGDIDIILIGRVNTQEIIPVIETNYREFDRDQQDDQSFDNSPLSGRYAVFNIDGDNKTEDELPINFRMRVSSRHLILASKMLRAMLEGPWIENSLSSSKSGRREINSTGWDPAALAIVLDAVHGRYSDVPESVNLGLLTRISVIVDYYGFQECLRHIGNVWITNLRASCEMPKSSLKASLLWLSVAWIFSQKEIITSKSRIILMWSRGLDMTLALPLGDTLDTIEAKRQKLISKFLACLHELRGKLVRETRCAPMNNPDCPTMMLGKLARAEYCLETLNGHPVAPFKGLSIVGLLVAIARSSGQDMPMGYFGNPLKPFRTCSCTLVSRLADRYHEIDQEIQSFEC
uniref:WGS project CBMF000000000 data, contig CS5834_c000016 n=1 Tax=Fusarium pseudograminearum CS5834 TaxID=1318459 RepID=A0A096PEG6_FUSPS|nr:unnamed protein product [Fusarium pseudograminearum CS5834]